MMSCILLLLCFNFIALHAAEVPWNWPQQQQLQQYAIAGAQQLMGVPSHHYQAGPQPWLYNGQNGDRSTGPSQTGQRSFLINGWRIPSVNAQRPLIIPQPPISISAQQGSQMVRQCSCDETSRCFDELNGQAWQFIDTCWFHFNTITTRPQDLRRCVEGKRDVIDHYMQCFKARLLQQGCASTKNGSMIPRQDITEILKGDLNLTSENKYFNMLMEPLKEAIEAAKNFLNCAKQRLYEHIGSGVCLDRYGCQPLLPTSHEALAMFQLCTKGLDMKKAADMCSCVFNAGVSELRFVCMMIRVG